MNTDLTTGNTSRLLWAFSIPMLISVVFQQFYNIADSSIGCTVVVSQLFGSKHYAMLKTAVGTICCAGVIVSIVLSLWHLAG